MEWLEQLSVAHLDLKPENCIRTKAGELKLCDAAGVMRVDAGEPSAALLRPLDKVISCAGSLPICCCMHFGLVSCPAALRQNEASTTTLSCCRPGRG